mmetsp:Transcript_12863/g.27929  ORF Transcript_12863/g.27929 Transcript_12863/m.27929 type:complete len:229 (-) Transcript_12863:235-921(-)
MQQELVHQKQLEPPLGLQREWQLQAGHRQELEQLQTCLQMQGRERPQIDQQVALGQEHQINLLRLVLLQTQEQPQGFQKPEWEQRHQTNHPLPVQELQIPPSQPVGQILPPPALQKPWAPPPVGQTHPQSGPALQMPRAPPLVGRTPPVGQTHPLPARELQIHPPRAPLPVGRILRQRVRGQASRMGREPGPQRERLLVPVQTSFITDLFVFFCFSYANVLKLLLYSL